jgi:hypothetical protein
MPAAAAERIRVVSRWMVFPSPQPRSPNMPLQFRRVVTGHDENGRAVVKIDEMAKNFTSGRPGATACVVWTTQGFPVDNDGQEDESRRQAGTTLDNGTVFRVLELAPGSSPRNHRTDSIDYAVVMSGEIDMELRRLDRAFAGRRRARPARHDPQLGQPRQRALRDRLCVDRGEIGDRRRQGAAGSGLSRPPARLVRLQAAKGGAQQRRVEAAPVGAADKHADRVLGLGRAALLDIAQDRRRIG